MIGCNRHCLFVCDNCDKIIIHTYTLTILNYNGNIIHSYITHIIHCTSYTSYTVYIIHHIYRTSYTSYIHTFIHSYIIHSFICPTSYIHTFIHHTSYITTQVEYYRVCIPSRRRSQVSAEISYASNVGSVLPFAENPPPTYILSPTRTEEH